MENLDQPDRVDEIRSLIGKKKALQKFYLEVYEKFRSCLDDCPKEGLALELGSGGGFTKNILPEIITSDIIPYPGVDQVIDATTMPFPKDSVRFIGMLNTLHHIPDAAAFFREAERTLVPGGRLLIIDQNPGLFSYPILKWLHHEAFDPKVQDWKFISHGPLSSANGALAWVIFRRDREKFSRQFPNLKVLRYETHTPLKYWLAGGLKKWSLIPEALYPLVTKSDQLLCKISPRFGSFVDIEIEKISK